MAASLYSCGIYRMLPRAAGAVQRSGSLTPRRTGVAWRHRGCWRAHQWRSLFVVINLSIARPRHRLEEKKAAGAPAEIIAKYNSNK